MASTTPERAQNTPETPENLATQTRGNLKKLDASVPPIVKSERDVNEVKKYVGKEMENLNTQVQKVKEREKSSQSGANFWNEKLNHAQTAFNEARDKYATAPSLEKKRALKAMQDARIAFNDTKKNLEKAKMNKSEYEKAGTSLQQHVEAATVRSGNAEDAQSKGNDEVAMKRAQSAAEFATVSSDTADEAMSRARQKAALHNEGKLSKDEVTKLQTDELASLSEDTADQKLNQPSLALGAAAHEFRTGTTAEITIADGTTYKMNPDGKLANLDGTLVDANSDAFKEAQRTYTDQTEKFKAESDVLMQKWTRAQTDLNMRPEDSQKMSKIINDLASPFLSVAERNALMENFRDTGREAVLKVARIRASEQRADAEKDYAESWMIMDRLLNDIRSCAMLLLSIKVASVAGEVATAALTTSKAVQAAPLALNAARTAANAPKALNAAKAASNVPRALNAAKPVQLAEVTMGTAPKVINPVASGAAKAMPKITANTAKAGAEGIKATPGGVFVHDFKVALESYEKMVKLGKGAKADKIADRIKDQLLREPSLEKLFKGKIPAAMKAAA